MEDYSIFHFFSDLSAGDSSCTVSDKESSARVTPACCSSSSEVLTCTASKAASLGASRSVDSIYEQKMKVRSVSEFVKTPLA